MTDFSSVPWNAETATFTVTDTLPEVASARVALVFPFYGDRIVLADIIGRGWCIPSGHVEAGETFEQAVRREAYEEAGVTLGRVVYLGYFVLTHRETGAVRYAPTFVGEVTGLSPSPMGVDTRGMQLVNVEDVASLYFAWDDLLAEVFTYAYEVKERSFPVGIPIRTLTGEP